MKSGCILVMLVLFSISRLIAQEALYEPIEYAEAYASGTRLRTGVPGDAYWQNHSTYKIVARFDPITKVVTGHLNVTYYNQSPDTLKSIVFKLMQNVYKKGANRQMAVSEQIVHDGVEVKNIKCGTADLGSELNDIAPTVKRLRLPDALLPKSSIAIELDFETPVPKRSGFRSGTIDSSSFFVAYWFPQIAVYDDVFGWDTEEYVGVPETYNDVSDYDVELTLPSQYNIWATGEHLNEKSIYGKKVLQRIEKSRTSKEKIKILTEADFRKPNGKEVSWKFSARQVPDFAWGASDHYLWEGLAAENPDEKNLCWVQSAYPPGAAYFDMVAEIAKTSVEILSNEFPGIPYPYFKHITFRGTEGGGMEFPMIANNDVAEDTVNTLLVTAHELAHNYYPFMMGINERKFGWWDETMTTLMEGYVNDFGFPEHKITGFYDRSSSFDYLAPRHFMVPLITETSNIMGVLPSTINSYVKGPAAMDMLQNLIGKETFFAYNKSFMETWRGKHPTPWDFFYFVNTTRGEDINWFWDRWFFTYGHADVALVEAIQTGQYLNVTVRNVGRLPVPFKVEIKSDNGSVTSEAYNVSIWEKDQDVVELRIPVTGQVSQVSIDASDSYDADADNNTISHVSR